MHDLVATLQKIEKVIEKFIPEQQDVTYGALENNKTEKEIKQNNRGWGRKQRDICV